MCDRKVFTAEDEGTLASTHVSGNAFGHVCLCLCVFILYSSENLVLETSFLVHRYIVKIFRSSSYIKIIRSRSRSQWDI